MPSNDLTRGTQKITVKGLNTWAAKAQEDQLGTDRDMINFTKTN